MTGREKRPITHNWDLRLRRIEREREKEERERERERDFLLIGGKACSEAKLLQRAECHAGPITML